VRAVRTDEWKYMHYPHGDGTPDRYIGELYNVKSDPDERYNLWAEPKQAARIEELKTLLAERMKETGLTPENDKMPIDEGIKKELPDAKIR
jgi:arylsulfatase A-like enzyme